MDPKISRIDQARVTAEAAAQIHGEAGTLPRGHVERVGLERTALLLFETVRGAGFEVHLHRRPGLVTVVLVDRSHPEFSLS